MRLCTAYPQYQSVGDPNLVWLLKVGSPKQNNNATHYDLARIHAFSMEALLTLLPKNKKRCGCRRRRLRSDRHAGRDYPLFQMKPLRKMYMASWRKIDWILQNPSSDDYPVWVSVQKLEQQWKIQSDEYIGIGGSGQSIDDRYKNIGVWLRSTPKIWMPTISLNGGDTPLFTDGRHRFAWIRDHHVEALLVAVPPEEAGEFKRFFGTALEVSSWLDADD